MRPADVRTLRAVEPPLAGYLRPFKRDCAHLAQLLAEGLPVGAGVVLDPTMASESEGLREQARIAGIEVVLDPRVMELATPGGFARKNLRELPWAGVEVHSPDYFLGSRASSLVNEVAELAVDMKVSAVLAPTHFLEGRGSRWVAVDSEAATMLREALDAVGGEDIALYYVLASSFTVLDPSERARVLARLRDKPLDALWLRIHNFGTSSSGPVNLRRYVALCREAHQLGLPVVAERTGTVGLPLLALGCVGGIESGITFGDSFDAGAWQRKPSGKPFIPQPRVYLTEIGGFLPAKEAGQFLRRRGMHGHVCQGRGCCRRGVEDMLGDPRRHFVVSRAREIESLSRLPAGLRAHQYLETWLRPASDRATRAMQVDESLERHRKRLDQWRGAIGAIVEEDRQGVSRSLVPQGGRIRRRRPA
jgi:hypothetical protein